MKGWGASLPHPSFNRKGPRKNHRALPPHVLLFLPMNPFPLLPFLVSSLTTAWEGLEYPAAFQASVSKTGAAVAVGELIQQLRASSAPSTNVRQFTDTCRSGFGILFLPLWVPAFRSTYRDMHITWKGVEAINANTAKAKFPCIHSPSPEKLAYISYCPYCW